MKRSVNTMTHGVEDLIVMRKAIARLAERLGVDLSNVEHMRHCLDGIFSHFPTTADQVGECQELREMLVLMLRLEDCNSEDLGIDGLRRLWQKQRSLMNRFHMREPLRIRSTNVFQLI